MITKDHIIPRSKGGKDILDNYQPMCIICNSKKADKLEELKENK
jgi:5-methylcytosine-specific restriction endonuclease McrA